MKITIFIVAIVMMVGAGVLSAITDRDAKGASVASPETSSVMRGPKVYIDPDTGCEYLHLRWDFITPRMTAHGQKGCKQ